MYNPIGNNLRFGDIIHEASTFANRLPNVVDASSLLPNNFALFTCTRQIFSSLSPRIISEYWLDQHMLKLLLDNCETVPFAIKIFYLRRSLESDAQKSNEQLISEDEGFVSKLIDRLDFLKLFCVHKTYLTDNFIKTKIHDNPKVTQMLETLRFARALVGDLENNHPIQNKFITPESYRIFFDLNSKTSAAVRKDISIDIQNYHASNEEFRAGCEQCGMYETICSRLERPGEPESLLQYYLGVLSYLCMKNTKMSVERAISLFEIGFKLCEYDETSKFSSDIRAGARWIMYNVLEDREDLFSQLPSQIKSQVIPTVVRLCLTDRNTDGVSYSPAGNLAIHFSASEPELTMDSSIFDFVRQAATIPEPAALIAHRKLNKIFAEKFEEFGEIITSAEYSAARENIRNLIEETEEGKQLLDASKIVFHAEKQVRSSDPLPIEKEKRNDACIILLNLARNTACKIWEKAPDLLDVGIRNIFDASDRITSDTQSRAVSFVGCMIRALNAPFDIHPQILNAIIDLDGISALLSYIELVYDNVESRSLAHRDAIGVAYSLLALRKSLDPTKVTKEVVKKALRQILYGSVDAPKILKKMYDVAKNRLPEGSKLSWDELRFGWCDPDECYQEINRVIEEELRSKK
jgi:hypothetical protein